MSVSERRRDDLFTRHGVTWQRRWVGDNAGRYEWRSTCGRLLVWRANASYSASVEGRLVTAHAPSLLAGMEQASRENR